MLAIIALTLSGEQARHDRATGVEVTILPAQPIQEPRVEVVVYYGPSLDPVEEPQPDAWRIQEMAVADQAPLSPQESGEETSATLPSTPQSVVSAAATSPSSVLPQGGTVSQLSPDEARAVLRRAGWRESLIPQALAVACGIGNSRFPNGESNCHPQSTNGVYYGLFQIGPSWFDWFHVPFEEWSDPVANARLARWICEDYDIARGEDCWAQWSVKP